MTTEADRRHTRRLRAFYLDQPNEVSLEISTLCNASCTFCPYTTLERIGNKMPDDLIDKLIKEFATWKSPFWFAPFKVSEALLDKRLYPILKRMNAEVPFAITRIFTNGGPLNWSNAEKLNDINNLVLNISLNSHIKEEHEALMGIRFDQVIKNIDQLHESDFRHPVTVQRVGSNPEFVQYVLDRWPRFAPALIPMEAWVDFRVEEREIPDTFCARFFELNITSEGRCVRCCMTSGEKEEHYLPINDISKHTLLEIYNQPFWRDRRLNMLSRKDPVLNDPVCSICAY